MLVLPATGSVTLHGFTSTNALKLVYTYSFLDAHFILCDSEYGGRVDFWSSAELFLNSIVLFRPSTGRELLHSKSRVL